MRMSNAPILLFTYSRLEETIQVISALKKNIGSSNCELYIYSDGPKNLKDEKKVASVRRYLKTVSGFKSITIIERKNNLGLAESIISGVSEIFQKYKSVIVLEDDLITSTNFLLYMNQALVMYKNDPKVWSISGFSFPITYPQDYTYDAAFGVRASSWGWATWKDRWERIDWNVSDYNDFCKDRKAQKEFNRGGSDMCKMLNDQMSKKIDSWAIRFCYAQYKYNAYDLFPVFSKVESIGFGRNASHTKGMGNRFATELDVSTKTKFCFPEKADVNKSVLKQFRKPYSISMRLKYKFLGLWE